MWVIVVLIILYILILNYKKTKKTYTIASVHVLYKTKRTCYL